MANHTFRARSVVARLTGLDFGLRVRVEAHPLQQPIFEGAENFSAASLASELAEEVSRLRVHSYSMRAQLEHVTTALLANGKRSMKTSLMVLPRRSGCGTRSTGRAVRRPTPWA